ncbi:MAG: hypothetical protein A2Z47_08790 [Thermodesulfovibrio sp. RBG_19FT_COMBO_42_12]|nr:MAG: hypothetical protein A2Z47_08790 [Thermodesulfovibrio sp. RBG_19FT_COMBO_42_12]
MEKLIKAIIMLSPIIAWSLLVWYSSKWEKKYKDKKYEELVEMNYFKKKMRNDLLLWLSGFIATILFILLFVNLKLLK